MSGYRTVRPRALAALLALLVLLGLLALAAWRAQTLLASALNGRRERAQAEETTSEYTLRAEMLRQQARTRVGGWLSVVTPERVTLVGARGELRADVYPPIDGALDAPWAIVVHGGLGSSASQVQDVACELSLAGYRVLTPDLYAHGQSAGEICTLGVGDAQDVRAWVDWVLLREPEARIVLMGQDEGALAILLAASQGLPDAVTAAALDSVCADVRARCDAYRSEIGADSASDRALFDLALRLTAGISPGDVDPRASAEKCLVALLLISGTFDSEVPAWHSEDIASAAPDERLLLVEGASHGMARYVEPDAYYGAMIGLFDACAKKEE